MQTSRQRTSNALLFVAALILLLLAPTRALASEDPPQRDILEERASALREGYTFPSLQNASRINETSTSQAGDSSIAQAALPEKYRLGLAVLGSFRTQTFSDQGNSISIDGFGLGAAIHFGLADSSFGLWADFGFASLDGDTDASLGIGALAAGLAIANNNELRSGGGSFFAAIGVGYYSMSVDTNEGSASESRLMIPLRAGYMAYNGLVAYLGFGFLEEKEEDLGISVTTFEISIGYMFGA